jgi:DNA primase
MSKTDLNIVIEAIKSKISLSKIVSVDIALKKRGREFSGQCPFHQEKTASFFVNDEKGTFYCFGCGVSGDMIDYIMKKDRIHFHQAVEKLANIAGIKLPEQTQYNGKLDNSKKLMQKAVEYFSNTLSINHNAMTYCRKRGLDIETINKFSIGYSGNKQQFSPAYFRQLGFTDVEIESSGLFIIRNDNQKWYPRFSDRIMFPIYNNSGWPIAFGGRGIFESVAPKYLNSPETDLFRKSEILYGYNLASRSVSEKNPFVIVEGYMDVVVMHKFGFDTAVAGMGTSFSAEQLSKVWRYSNEPIVCLDGDNAGYNAMVRMMLMGMRYLQPGKSLRFCILPLNTDPDSILSAPVTVEDQSCVDILKNLLNQAISLIDFFWKHCLNLREEIQNKTPENIVKWKRDIDVCIDNIQDIEIRKLYKKTINDRLWLMQKKRKTNSNAQFSSHNPRCIVNKNEKRLLREALLLYTVIMRPSMNILVSENLSKVDFSDNGFENIKEAILSSSCSGSSDFSGLEDVVADIKFMCNRNYHLESLNDDELLNFWNEVFIIGFVDKIRQKEIVSAKKECDNELNSATWERLKAIKIDSIKKKV